MEYLLRQQRNDIILSLFEMGLKQAQQGKIVHLTQQMISKILQQQASGSATCQKREGKKSRLNEAQLAKLPSLLSKGAILYGFEGDYWTQERVKYVIEKEFNVFYCTKQVGRILDKIGWTRQKPQKKTFNKTLLK
jgi:transposase